MPPSNDVDVFAHCLGFIAIADPATGGLAGFNVTVGGGMGMTHNSPATFPRLADVLGFVPVSPGPGGDAAALAVAEAIVMTQVWGGRVASHGHVWGPTPFH